VHRSLLALTSLLLLASGCRHANLPVLPASHGELSRMMDRYLDDAPEPDTLLGGVDSTASDKKPRVVVEPAEAPAVMAEALRMLEGDPLPAQVKQAYADLQGACGAPLPAACDALRERFENPRVISPPRTLSPPADEEEETAMLGILRCQLSVEGVMRDCKVIEGGPNGLTEAMTRAVASSRYWPATFAGHPIELPYLFHFFINPRAMRFTREYQLGWAHVRTLRFPDSPHAWSHLAKALAKFAPDDPTYPSALERLHALAPEDWWAASELAWHHVQAGRYTEAEPLAKKSWRRESRNAYVLETLAAVSAGLGRCEEAVAHQRGAVAALPEPWPAPERQRFQRTLETYLQKCQGAGPAPVSGASP
jgi:hypothetical protein